MKTIRKMCIWRFCCTIKFTSFSSQSFFLCDRYYDVTQYKHNAAVFWSSVTHCRGDTLCGHSIIFQTSICLYLLLCYISPSFPASDFPFYFHSHQHLHMTSEFIGILWLRQWYDKEGYIILMYYTNVLKFANIQKNNK